MTVSVFSQSLNNEASVNKYQQSLNEKEDFWSKVKGVFKPKKDKKQVQRTSDPVLVKNDPNRTIRKVKRDRGNTITDYSENNVSEAPVQNFQEEPKSTVKKKKTFSQLWNELVNGKGYTPAKDYSAIRRKQRQQSSDAEPLPQNAKVALVPKKNEGIANNNNANALRQKNNVSAEKEVKKVEAKPILNKPENANITKKTNLPIARNTNNSIKEPQQQIVAKAKSDPIAPKAEHQLNPNDSKPLLPSSNPTAGKVQPAKTDLTSSNIKLDSKSNIPSNVKNLAAAEIKSKAGSESMPTVSELKPTASVDAKPKVIANVKPKPIADLKPKVMNEAKAKAVVPVVPDNTIRNEIQPLSLTRTASGTASYFFSGASFGKFYVVTNLASKGEVIKVINTQNGKSLLAEVMDELPSSDLKRGLILKLSDNAKLPLGQNNKSFSVKVNY